jgi:hypothetical protein
MSAALSVANIDLGRTYIYRSTNPDYGVTLELQIRVRGRNPRALICEVLQRRTFRATDEQPPDWDPPTVPTLLRLPLHHTVDAVSVVAVA